MFCTQEMTVRFCQGAYGGCGEMVNASDCESDYCQFESGYSPCLYSLKDKTSRYERLDASSILAMGIYWKIGRAV